MAFSLLTASQSFVYRVFSAMDNLHKDDDNWSEKECKKSEYLRTRIKKTYLEFSFQAKYRDNYVTPTFSLKMNIVIEKENNLLFQTLPSRMKRKWVKDGFLEIEGERFTNSPTTSSLEKVWEKAWSDCILQDELSEVRYRDLMSLALGEVSGESASRISVDIVTSLFFKNWKKEKAVKEFFPAYVNHLESWGRISLFKKERVYRMGYRIKSSEKKIGLVLLCDENWLPAGGYALEESPNSLPRVEIDAEGFLLDEKGKPLEVFNVEYPESLSSLLTSSNQKERDEALRVKELLDKGRQRIACRLKNAHKLKKALEKKFAKG
jgi:hypothetical protein